MRVLITGASGFLGSNLVCAAAARGWNVRAMIHRKTASACLEHPCVEAVSGDVLDPGSLRAAVDGCDVVFHTAGLVSNWEKDRSLFDRVNVEGAANVFGVCQEKAVAKVVYTSSFMALGPTDGTIGDENTRHASRDFHNDYERTKTLGLELAERFVQDGAPIVTVFPGVIYGPGPLTQGNHVATIILDFMKGKIPGVFGSGRQIWNFVFVSDVVQGHLLAAERGEPGRSYCLGGENVEVMEFFRTLADLTGLPSPKRKIPFRVMKLVASFYELSKLVGKCPKLTRAVVEVYRHDWAYSSDRARRELGYAPRSLEQGLRLTLDWIYRHGWVDK